MADQSYLDKKYFIDANVYNCPFCKRGNVRYSIIERFEFDWTETKNCFGYLVQCSSCNNTSMHLSYVELSTYESLGTRWPVSFKNEIELDDEIFYSVPTSFFVIDNRIPKIFRELISEAEGCVKMNFLTGASTCTRKAIYELTVHEKAEGDDYETKIKFLKEKHHNINPDYFDILCHIKDMASDKIHEQSWDKWNSEHLYLFIETLKSVLYEIYVYPMEKSERSVVIQKMLEKVKTK